MSDTSKIPWRRSAYGLVLRVRLTPKSAVNAIEGVEKFDDDWVLKARVRAAPEKGAANEAMLKLVGDWLGVPGAALGLASGGKSRVKSVAVKGNPERLIEVATARLAELSK